ncbi:hypothetical protein Kpol_1004p62 [Vanderwaltozyma polyspora DSM 70294]|uniref:Arginine N-methyltransferase 2 n=1 Tax=Vanderwaltozyma polyspora (strain ATCC 22028 / DSM 70294 / BCRC 21397 / CBS 2163 / NBRC 10782 / NRRL Y-8283 / UCD 57-17) TaxID=436907 RepID=A7TJB6_VANPO|nr:uncharacterized protein Kpol_1004p62 [Vanderwaltozyma polyspora DSM 70294]EDO17685.1 hypothetical protein Kpol_1004p62 [Vanderwaltozyma polyspora DSM 70294]
MSELHDLLKFAERPVGSGYLEKLRYYLSNGIPSTYTVEQLNNYLEGKEDDECNGSNTTPLHVLAKHLPENINDEEEKVILEMMNTLFEYGAGWNFIDAEDKTVGDHLIDRGYGIDSLFYRRLVEAGVSAELLLRKVNENIEFLEEQEDDEEEEVLEEVKPEQAVAVNSDATANEPEVFLSTELEYRENALVTKDEQDGVMMDWEDEIMKMSAKSLLKTVNNSGDGDDNESKNVLNIGFGMGIIDGYIEEYRDEDTKHYICEAHPDVLAKMKEDGWFDKKGVVVLTGRWQDELNKIIDEGGIYFDGIYYDTFSEGYEDMIELYDNIVGLLKPDGIFSFFNGLGGDRQLCYEVYKEIVSIDMKNYGMRCEYRVVPVGIKSEGNGDKGKGGIEEPNWQDIKRSYYNIPYYYHPEIQFM